MSLSSIIIYKAPYQTTDLKSFQCIKHVREIQGRVVVDNRAAYCDVTALDYTELQILLLLDTDKRT